MEGKAVKAIRIQRWTANRKREIVLEVLKGRKTIVDVAREKELKRHREKIGELVLQIDVLKKAETILSEEESSCSE